MADGAHLYIIVVGPRKVNSIGPPSIFQDLGLLKAKRPNTGTQLIRILFAGREEALAWNGGSLDGNHIEGNASNSRITPSMFLDGRYELVSKV